ncbi:MAG: hypothetical protein ACPGQL_07765 [Thermoplasmatota archaeon]
MRASLAWQPMAALVLAVLVAGCTDDAVGGSVSVAYNGNNNGEATRFLECPETGTIAVSFSGSGQVNVKITDGAGNIILDDGASASGAAASDSKPVPGEPGRWRLDVTWTNVAGSFTATLSC